MVITSGDGGAGAVSQDGWRVEDRGVLMAAMEEMALMYGYTSETRQGAR